MLQLHFVPLLKTNQLFLHFHPLPLNPYPTRLNEAVWRPAPTPATRERASWSAHPRGETKAVARGLKGIAPRGPRLSPPGGGHVTERPPQSADTRLREYGRKNRPPWRPKSPTSRTGREGRPPQPRPGWGRGKIRFVWK